MSGRQAGPEAHRCWLRRSSSLGLRAFFCLLEGLRTREGRLQVLDVA